MLGSIIVALVTASLLIVGVVLVNLPKDSVSTDEAESYDEGFFGSLDALAGKFGESSRRGDESKTDRYQEYLETQERIAETNRILEPENAPPPSSITQAPRPSVVTPPQTSESQPEPTKPPVITTPTPEPESEPEPTKPAPAPSISQPPLPSIPPPSSVGVDRLSNRLNSFLSGVDLDEDIFDESDEGSD